MLLRVGIGRPGGLMAAEDAADRGLFVLSTELGTRYVAAGDLLANAAHPIKDEAQPLQREIRDDLVDFCGASCDESRQSPGS